MAHNIVGTNIKDGKEYLIYPGCGSKEHMESVLNRMLTNPTEHDKHNMEGYKDFRLDEIPDKDCWWNQGSLD